MTIRTLTGLIGMLVCVFFFALNAGASSDPLTPGSAALPHEETTASILVEIFLAPDRRGDLDTIKRELADASITRVRAQFFRLGNPPQNIAVGKNIPAPVARLAIRQAVTYNRGIKFLLPQFRYFPDHIVIGSSAFDEASQIPISPEDVERLSDPLLTTPEFHALYRRLTGEDRRLPTYLK